MSNTPACLPPALADQMHHEFGKLDGDYSWKIARFAERAFAEGYDRGHSRGYDEGYRRGRVDATPDGNGDER